MIKNEGQLPQAYVENSHPAIITRENWDMVQVELKRRSKFGNAYSANSVLASRIVCGDCGAFYGRKVWHKGTAFEKQIYQCNCKFNKSKEKCMTPHLSEDEIKTSFLKAYNVYIGDRTRIIEDTKKIIKLLEDTTTLEAEITSLRNDIDVISELVRKMVRENSLKAQEQVEYNKRYSELVDRYNKAKKELDTKINTKATKQNQATNMKAFISELENKPDNMLNWDDDIWVLMIDKATIHRDKTISFTFKERRTITV